MNKDKWICLIALLIVTICSGTTWAGEELDKIVIDNISRYYDLDPHFSEIEIRKNRLKADPNQFDSVNITPLTQGEPCGVLSFRVELINGDQLIEQGQVRVRIKKFEFVYVATELIRRHNIINDSNVQLKLMDITYLSDVPIQDPAQINEQWAKRNIKPEQIITNKIIENIPLVKQGKRVTILCSSGGFEISVPGLTLEQGSKGDLIRVQNSQSNKTIKCTVVSANTVEVALN